MRYPQYLGNKFSGDSIVTITYNTSRDILDSWLKKEDVNEYRIVKQ